MKDFIFNEARVAMDSLKTKKLGVDIDSAYIQGARWQFEQNKAVIEGLQNQVDLYRGQSEAKDKLLKSAIESGAKEIEGKDREIERLKRWGDHLHQLCADHLPREIWVENRFKEFK